MRIFKRNNFRELLSEISNLYASPRAELQQTAIKLATSSHIGEHLVYALKGLHSQNPRVHFQGWKALDSWYKQYRSRPWQHFNSEDFVLAQRLLQNLHAMALSVPYRVQEAWKALPRCLAAFEKSGKAN